MARQGFPNSTPPTVPPPLKSVERKHAVGGMDLGCCVEPSSVIWMMLTLFAVTVFLTILFCLLVVATRWIYKRRMKKKCDALRVKYLQEAKQRKMDEMRAKRLALRPILPFRPKTFEKDLERTENGENDRKRLYGLDGRGLNLENRKVPYELTMDDRKYEENMDGRRVRCGENVDDRKVPYLDDRRRLYGERKVPVLETKGQLLEHLRRKKREDGNLERTRISDENSKKKMTPETSPFTTAGSHVLSQLSETREPVQFREHLTRPAPSGFSHLQAVVKKSLKECQKSLSYPEMPARRGK